MINEIFLVKSLVLPLILLRLYGIVSVVFLVVMMVLSR